ncbi:MAG: hypothetical protein HOO91_21145 [Bacteroidales bacterium]|nr:hypothetical protein [Bacteroidales bacterium]
MQTPTTNRPEGATHLSPTATPWENATHSHPPPCKGRLTDKLPLQGVTIKNPNTQGLALVLK